MEIAELFFVMHIVSKHLSVLFLLIYIRKICLVSFFKKKSMFRRIVSLVFSIICRSSRINQSNNTVSISHFIHPVRP